MPIVLDLFTVPTVRFQVLYVFLVPAHEPPRILRVLRYRNDAPRAKPAAATTACPALASHMAA
ncbi:MAG: hypothetical protein DMG58_35405 [Acidobacteria bacterium]|nr:MAG: hypothetical protein DMG58_35405 [Acidobacteriota bacterium]